MKKKYTLIAVILGLLIGYLIYERQTQKDGIETSPVASNPQESIVAEKLPEPGSPSLSSQEVGSGSPEAETSLISLNGGNFEGLVNKCFQGEKCALDESPWKMYQDFKLAGNQKAIDSLISFMRSQLRNPNWRDKYKDPLKKMIEDFYSPQEIQFQQAAYYNYLGDLQKSLDLYLELEKKSKTDPSIRGVPKLNIANTYYDMKRFREALPYYESALQEHLSGNFNVSPDPAQFIEGRIRDIKSKL